jgi:glycosyltransferase involved in cell wall biosynthesis
METLRDVAEIQNDLRLVLGQMQAAEKSDSISKNDITIVLPALNEESAVLKVLEEIGRHGFHKVLLVDGYSTDRTYDIMKEYAIPVVQQHGRGKTGAIKTALEHVATAYILMMDCDYTYSAADIEKFLPHGKNYDLIIGARKSVGNGRKGFSYSHRFGNKIITKTFNFFFGTRLSDVLSGMYLLKTETARKFQLDSTDFTAEVEIAAQAALMGSITEVPIQYRERIGKQKLSTWRDGPKILSACIKLARSYNPAFLLSLTAGLTAIPGIAMLGYSLYEYIDFGVVKFGWAVGGMVLVLFGSQALMAGTISVLMKRSEHRMMIALTHIPKKT